VALAGAGTQGEAFRATLMVKLVFVLSSGVSAALHTLIKSPWLPGLWAGVGLVSGLCAVLLGVSIVKAD
jgi:hypothetical protein